MRKSRINVISVSILFIFGMLLPAITVLAYIDPGGGGGSVGYVTSYWIKPGYGSHVSGSPSDTRTNNGVNFVFKDRNYVSSIKYGVRYHHVLKVYFYFPQVKYSYFILDFTTTHGILKPVIHYTNRVTEYKLYIEDGCHTLSLCNYKIDYICLTWDFNNDPNWNYYYLYLNHPKIISF